MIPRTIQQIFEARDAAAREAEERADRGANPPELRVTATMMEIYNEDIKDLLGGSSSVKHDVKHDKRGDTTVTGLRAARVESAAEVDALMKRAQAARTTASTLMNDHSSRSHMVLTLALDGVDASGRPVKRALNLVDLAGSERLSRTGATGDRLKEAQSINKSLSALGDVIFALANKESHVPFRNSKLTYLLQNALGGDAKTLMFVNVAPDAASSQETLCSLRFAAKVNNCRSIGKTERSELHHEGRGGRSCRRVEGKGEGSMDVRGRADGDNCETRATLYVFTSDSLRIHISSRFGV